MIDKITYLGYLLGDYNVIFLVWNCRKLSLGLDVKIDLGSLKTGYNVVLL